MTKAQDSVKENDVIIFLVDEWGDGRKTDFDGNVQFVRDDGVDVLYLSGYRSRNDFIPWEDIIAKVDKRKPYVKLDSAPFSGHFEVYISQDIDNGIVDYE